MTKRDFIRLAEYIRDNNNNPLCQAFTPAQIEHLADFCREQNSNFKRQRWLDYIAGECGPNGGAR
jgi:hypothetical protein